MQRPGAERLDVGAAGALHPGQFAHRLGQVAAAALVAVAYGLLAAAQQVIDRLARDIGEQAVQRQRSRRFGRQVFQQNRRGQCRRPRRAPRTRRRPAGPRDTAVPRPRRLRALNSAALARRNRVRSDRPSKRGAKSPSQRQHVGRVGAGEPGIERDLVEQQAARSIGARIAHGVGVPGRGQSRATPRAPGCRASPDGEDRPRLRRNARRCAQMRARSSAPCAATSRRGLEPGQDQARHVRERKAGRAYHRARERFTHIPPCRQRGEDLTTPRTYPTSHRGSGLPPRRESAWSMMARPCSACSRVMVRGGVTSITLE